MDELSLADLLQGLEDVQTRKTTVRLSERNVVELVIKLKAMGLLQQELLHTANGREYVTRRGLVDEVASLVGAKHRVPLVDLPAALGVDLMHCREAAESLAAQGATSAVPGDGVLLVQDELFAPAFFDGLVEEVEELLQEQDAAAMSDLAQRFGLGAALLSSALEPKCGAGIAARLEGGYLYTEGLTRRLKAQLRGGLRGAVAPVNVQTLVSGLGLGGPALTSAILPPILDQLQREGGVAGTLAGGATWVPAAHEAAQMEQARQFFSQNGYIDWQTVKRWVPRAGKEWCQQAFADALVLRDCLVSRATVAQLEAALDDAQVDGGWVDARSMLPSGMPEDDARALVQKTAEARSGLSVPCACYVVSDRLQLKLQATAEGVGRDAEERGAVEAAVGPAADDDKAFSTTSTTGVKPPGKNVARSAKGSSAKDDDGDADDDDWATSAAKRKGGKKPGRKAPGPKPASETKKTPSAVQHAAPPRRQSAAAPALETETRAALAAAWPDLAEEKELAAALLPTLTRAARASHDAARAARRAGGAERRRLLRESHALQLQRVYERLRVHASGAAALLSGAEPAAREAAVRHALRTLGASAADAALRHAAVDGLSEEEAEAGCALLGSGPVAGGGALGPANAPAVGAQPAGYAFPGLTAGERGRLAGTQGPEAQAMVQAADAGGDMDEFLGALESFAEREGLRLRPPGKRQEKELVAAHAAALRDQLASTPPGDGPAVLALAVPLLAARAGGKCVNLPGRALGPALATLAPTVGPETGEKLAALHAAVLAHLTGQGGEDMARLAAQVHAELMAEQ